MSVCLRDAHIMHDVCEVGGERECVCTRQVRDSLPRLGGLDSDGRSETERDRSVREKILPRERGTLWVERTL